LSKQHAVPDKDPEKGDELVQTPHKPILVGAGILKFLRSLAFTASGQFYS